MKLFVGSSLFAITIVFFGCNSLSAQANSVGVNSASAGEAFLRRPYTMFDRMLDSLNTAAAAWIAYVGKDASIRDFSNRMPPTGIVRYNTRADELDASFMFSLSRVDEPWQKVCSSYLRAGLDIVFGSAEYEEQRLLRLIGAFGVGGQSQRDSATAAARVVEHKIAGTLLFVGLNYRVRTCSTKAGSMAVSFTDTTFSRP